MPEINKLHYTFCKYLLGVKPSTSNDAVLGELGRFPLATLCKQRALCYCLKLVNDPNSLIYTVLNGQYNFLLCLRLNTSSKSMWSNAVIDVFNNLGFSYLSNNVNNDHKDLLTQIIKDQFIQQWHDVIANPPKNGIL